tara:strand:- start:370 stop:483 length:114 start_codon:yes stop_codon:yes gene_type:complete
MSSQPATQDAASRPPALYFRDVVLDSEIRAVLACYFA